MQSRQENWRTARALLFTFVGMILVMTGFELLKDFLHPDITLWESHTLTIAVSTLIAVVAAYFVRRRLARRNFELSTALTALEIAQGENALAIAELRQALADVKQLRGLLPICSHCKSIRNDTGYWSTVEGYISAHTEAEFTHSICPQCLQKYYADVLDADGAG